MHKTRHAWQLNTEIAIWLGNGVDEGKKKKSYEKKERLDKISVNWFLLCLPCPSLPPALVSSGHLTHWSHCSTRLLGVSLSLLELHLSTLHCKNSLFTTYADASQQISICNLIVLPKFHTRATVDPVSALPNIPLKHRFLYVHSHPRPSPQ